MITKAESLAWLKQLPDSCGECDRCHNDPVNLWSLPMDLDREPDAAWQFCAACFKKIVQREAV